MNKLAIVGSGPDTRDNAPWDDPSFDIWVFNEAGNHSWCKRWNAVFQMHEPEIYKGHNTKDVHHWEWLQQKHFKPIYMQELDPLVPDSVRYPLEEAKALAGVQMFPSTFAYMAALAVLNGYEQVRIFGVELSVTEYQSQANGYLFWFGFLRGRLSVENVDSAILHLGQNIFEVPLYGYEGEFSLGCAHFQERVKFLDAQWSSSEKNLQNMKKAIERAVEKKEYEKVQQFSLTFQTAAMTCGEFAGALAEAERYHTFGDRYADRGGFETAAAEAQIEGEKHKALMLHEGGKVEYLWNVWKQTNSVQAVNQMLGFIEAMGKCAYDTGAQLGKYHENVSYIVRYDDMAQANGVVK